MAEAIAATWTSDQRRMLQALGHTLWQVPRNAGADRTSPNDHYATANPLSASTARGGQHAVASRLALLEPMPLAGSAPHAMLLAIISAAGIRLDEVDWVTESRDALLTLPLLATLRRDAATRRSLWPSLRRLRRMLLANG